MRGTLAKQLRRVANQNIPLSPAIADRAYAVMPGTTRRHMRPVVMLNADGTHRVEQVEAFLTHTFRLSGCRRYFTQKFKRAFKKGIH